jgi:DNA-binding NarL/FixJ family response regulator
MTIRVLLTDDHRMFREALRASLQSESDLNIVGEASNGAETFAAIEICRPDVVVLDIALPDINGIDVAQQLRKRHPALHIVALSGYSDRLFLDEMLKAGAQAYVLKSSGADELIAAIHAVVAGKSFLSPELTSRLIQETQQSNEPLIAPPSVLGRRETEVLRWLAKGLRSIEIAEQMGIAASTVEVHRRNIRQKLGVHTTAELTRYAVRHGLSAA